MSDDCGDCCESSVSACAICTDDDCCKNAGVGTFICIYIAAIIGVILCSIYLKVVKTTLHPELIWNSAIMLCQLGTANAFAMTTGENCLTSNYVPAVSFITQVNTFELNDHYVPFIGLPNSITMTGKISMMIVDGADQTVADIGTTSFDNVTKTTTKILNITTYNSITTISNRQFDLYPSIAFINNWINNSSNNNSSDNNSSVILPNLPYMSKGNPLLPLPTNDINILNVWQRQYSTKYLPKVTLIPNEQITLTTYDSMITPNPNKCESYYAYTGKQSGYAVKCSPQYLGTYNLKINIALNSIVFSKHINYKKTDNGQYIDHPTIYVGFKRKSTHQSTKSIAVGFLVVCSIIVVIPIIVFVINVLCECCDSKSRFFAV